MTELHEHTQKTPVLLWAAPLAAASLILLYILFGGNSFGVAFGLLLGGIGLWAGRRPRTAPALIAAEEPPNPPSVPAEVLNVIESHLAQPEGSMGQVRAIISDAAGQLSTGFSELGTLVQSQQEGLRQMLEELKGRSGDSGTTTITIDRLAGEMADTAALLGRFVRLVVRISKQSMDLYYCVEGVSERLDGVFTLLNDVKSIADKTNLLALNAAIESARAGEAGRCFQVVATEIRQLAQDSKRVSEQISAQVHQAGEAVKKARAITELNASQDLSVLLTSKVRIDSLGSAIALLDQNVREKLDSVSDISSQIAARSSQSIRGLQFEDIARQILERSQEDLAGLRSMLRSVKESAENSSASDTDIAADLSALAQNLIGHYQANAQHKPDQETVSAGEIELF